MESDFSPRSFYQFDWPIIPPKTIIRIIYETDKFQMTFLNDPLMYEMDDEKEFYSYTDSKWCHDMDSFYLPEYFLDNQREHDEKMKVQKTLLELRNIAMIAKSVHNYNPDRFYTFSGETLRKRYKNHDVIARQYALFILRSKDIALLKLEGIIMRDLAQIDNGLRLLKKYKYRTSQVVKFHAKLKRAMWYDTSGHIAEKWLDKEEKLDLLKTFHGWPEKIINDSFFKICSGNKEFIDYAMINSPNLIEDICLSSVTTEYSMLSYVVYSKLLRHYKMTNKLERRQKVLKHLRDHHHLTIARLYVLRNEVKLTNLLFEEDLNQLFIAYDPGVIPRYLFSCIRAYSMEKGYAICVKRFLRDIFSSVPFSRRYMRMFGFYNYARYMIASKVPVMEPSMVNINPDSNDEVYPEYEGEFQFDANSDVIVNENISHTLLKDCDSLFKKYFE